MWQAVGPENKQRIADADGEGALMGLLFAGDGVVKEAASAALALLKAPLPSDAQAPGGG